jgi:hypothetical protein
VYKRQNQNRPDEAVRVYEKIMIQDSTNYESCAFLGNYYYLQGENAVKKAETDFAAIPQPNRMQVAHYQNELRRIFETSYWKSDLYLQKALLLKKNDHLEKLRATILAFREKLGLVPVTLKKKR